MESSDLKRKERGLVSHMLLKAEEGSQERRVGSGNALEDRANLSLVLMQNPISSLPRNPSENPRKNLVQKAPITPFLSPPKGKHLL